MKLYQQINILISNKKIDRYNKTLLLYDSGDPQESIIDPLL